MISDDLKNIVGKLNQQGKMIFPEGALEEQIIIFEKEHNIKFPKKFKEWLLFADGGELFLPAGVQLYGVAHKPIIDVNDNDRPCGKYIVIGALSSGDPILCEKSGERISVYNHKDGKIEDDETYLDFFVFLNELYDMLGFGS
ncbi:MAG: SMI1/KNR4 family protein [Bacilli bacterium]|nr:SMI1/KNR4 family protein [Bacilli bacterium]